MRVISFVVPVRNDALRLQRCLMQIRRNESAALRVDLIVVDNGSVDGSAEVARQAGATVLRMTGVSVGALRNAGARAAAGDIIAFVDADHEIDAAWARYAVETLRDGTTGAAGAMYHAPRHGTWVQRTYDGLRVRTAGCHEVGWLGSGNLAVRSDAFHRVGGFNPALETCEDVDFCQRLRAAGFRIVSDDRLRSVHHGDPSTLRALFLGELWRGRDNLRISLRGPMSWRDAPSIAIPLIDLAALMVTAACVVVAPFEVVRLAALSAAVIGALASLRAARIVACRRAFGVADLLQSFAVACVYDLARALALVLRTTHDTRRAACAG
jgi:GT2 family glycosyltransferase